MADSKKVVAAAPLSARVYPGFLTSLSAIRHPLFTIRYSLSASQSHVRCS